MGDLFSTQTKRQQDPGNGAFTNSGITGGGKPAPISGDQNFSYNGPAASTNSGYSGTFGNPTPDDPFGYSGGSLLNPWTKEMPTIPHASGGGFSMDPFQYQDFNFKQIDPGTWNDYHAFNDRLDYQAYNRPQDYNFERTSAPTQFAFGQGVPQRGEYGYQQGAGPERVQAISGPDRFAGPQGQINPDRFTGPGNFKAPDVTDDPGYKFRLQQGMDAMSNSMLAKGTARGGDAMKALNDYAQGSASQEYGNAYNRAFGAFNQDFANKQSAFQTDTNAQMSAQNQNFNQALGAYNANTGFQQAAQGMNLQAQQVNAANQMNWQQTGEAQRQAAYGMNAQTQLAQQGQAYNQAQQTWAGNTDRSMQQQQFNSQMGLQANNMNAQNALAAYNANQSAQQGVFQSNLAANNANNQNSLAGFNANANAMIGAGNLNYQSQSGAWDRNYNKAQQAYNQQYQQGASNAAAGAAAQNMDYERQMQQYGMGYDMYRQNQNDQFGRLMAMTGVGQNAMGQMGAYGMGMGNQYADAGYGAANARGSGYMGAAAGYGGAIQGVGSAISQGLMFGNSDMRNMAFGGGGYGGGGGTNPYGVH